VNFAAEFHATELAVQVESRCVSLLRSNCSSRPLRAVKSVRATMDAMEPLLRTLPNFRVIHLIRDPRAVALSRIEFDVSVRGLYTSKVTSLSRMWKGDSTGSLEDESPPVGSRGKAPVGNLGS